MPKDSALSVAQGDTDFAVRVADVGKAYQSYVGSLDFLKELALGASYHKKEWALRNVSFSVARGEIVGIVGSNGAGKSTLLKIIAGTLNATEGSVAINGRLSAILELGTGFHPDYSGRENIITGGMCLGMTKEEVLQRMDWIIDFSELRHVIDRPFKTYSSGMKARLTFSTAISINPEVFIVDEALAAGDSYFVSKCIRRIKEICESGATVLFVSHSSYLVIELCDRAIWIDRGQVMAVGPAYEVAKAYEKQTLEEINKQLVNSSEPVNAGNKLLAEVGFVDEHRIEAPNPNLFPDATYVLHNRGVEITSLSLHSATGEPRQMFETGEDVVIRVAWRGRTEDDKIAVGLRIDGLRIQAIAGYTSDESEIFLNEGKPLNGQGSFSLVLKQANLGRGGYFVSISIKTVDVTGSDGTLLFLADRALRFVVNRKKKYPHEYACELDVELVEDNQRLLASEPS